MSIDEIVLAWKSDEEDSHAEMLANPVGEKLSEQELQEVIGGRWCDDPRCWLISVCIINTCAFSM